MSSWGNYLSQGQKIMSFWLPCLVLMNKFELAISWWLEKRGNDISVDMVVANDTRHGSHLPEGLVRCGGAD